MKTTRLEYPEVGLDENSIRKAIFTSPTFESWPKPVISSTTSTVSTTPLPSVTTTTSTLVSNANPTTNSLLSEQDTNKQTRMNRKAKRRNNMRYMTQPVRLIEIQEIQEEDNVTSHD